MSLSEVAVRLLRSERQDIAATLTNAYEQDYDRLTVWDGWRVRDLMAHLIEVLHRIGAADPGFTGSVSDAAVHVAARRNLPGAELVLELDKAYAAAAAAPDALRLALPAWLYANDLREALNAAFPYSGNAVAEAATLLVHASVAQNMTPVDVTLTDAAEHGLDGAHVCLGDPTRAPEGWLRTNVAGLFRIIGGRRAELVEREVVGVQVEELAIFR